MKIAWTHMKGACLLLLGMATTAGGRSFAADINMLSFATPSDTSATATVGVAETSPFKDESAAAPAKAVPVEPATVATAPQSTTEVACCSDAFSGAPGRYWFSGQYIFWQTPGQHLPPLVSTLGGPTGTTPLTLYGDRDVQDGDHDGYRLNVGMWLDCKHCWGLEADYFDIASRNDNYDSGFVDGYNNGVAFPIVRLVYDPATYNTSGLGVDAVGYPGYSNGRITVDTSSYFQSAGVILRHELRATEWTTNGHDVDWMDSSARTFRLDAIGGYRFARLIDNVNEQSDSFVFATGTTYSDYAFNYTNDYRTVNSFNGGELGLNAVYTFGRWSLDIVGKAALGNTHEYISIYNQQTEEVSNARTLPTPPYTANSSPLQTFSQNRFAAIPELVVTGGYQVTEHFKVTVGYDLFYWSAVARAGNQIAVEPTTGYPYGTVDRQLSAAAVVLSCRDAITLPGQWSASWSRGAVLTGTPKGVCRQTSKKKGREPRGPCPFL